MHARRVCGVMRIPARGRFELQTREIMVRRIFWTLALAGALVAVHPYSAYAADGDNADHAKSEQKDTTPVPKEDASVTHGSVEIGGRTVHYTATAGNLVIRNDKGEPDASFFYVAYTADDGNPG